MKLTWIWAIGLAVTVAWTDLAVSLERPKLAASAGEGGVGPGRATSRPSMT
jgi:hypothetical protein